MTYFYATTDTNGDGKITQNAYIAKFATEAEVREFLLRGFNPIDFDLDRAEIVAGCYGDCWIKLHDPLTERNAYTIEPFTADQVSVRGPGQHPGSRAWWIDPTENVAVAIVPLRDNG